MIMLYYQGIIVNIYWWRSGLFCNPYPGSLSLHVFRLPITTYIDFYSIHTPEILSKFSQWSSAKSPSLAQSSCLLTSWSHLHYWPLAHWLLTLFSFCLAPPALCSSACLAYVRQRSVLKSACSGPIHLLLLASYTYLLALVCLPGCGTPSPAGCILAAQTLPSLLNNNSKLIHAPLPLFPELGIPSVLSSKLLIILPILSPFPVKDGFF